MEKITVVKIGGNVIDDPAALRGFLADFASPVSYTHLTLPTNREV